MEAVVAYFKVKPQDTDRVTEENHEEHQVAGL
jgi:hypothetical protein